MSVTRDVENKMKNAIAHLKEELQHLRTGRADPAILNSVVVEVYGAQMKIRDLATITTPEARQLLITPFDNNNLGSIRKAIETANIGMQPIVDGHVIRMNVPTMDETMRKEMVKQAKRKGEDAKIGIRNARREGNDTLKQQKSAGDIAEDQQKKSEHIIQKLTDDHCKTIDEIVNAKEKEIMAV